MLSEFIKRLFFRVPKKPRKIQIEITNKCNLDCLMCPRKDFGLQYENMDFETLKSIAEKIPEKTQVTLTGWGEPLLYPQIHEAIQLFKQKNCFVELTTNGILLNSEMRKLISDGLDSISISVDSFKQLEADDSRHQTAFKKDTLINIIGLREKNRKPLIIIQPTLHKDKSDDLLDLIREAKKIGVDRINITRLDTRFNKNLETLNAKEEFEFAKKIMKLSDEIGIRVDYLPFTAFTGIKRMLFNLFVRQLFRKDKSCPKLYDYIYVTYSGKVTPCCSLPKYEIGDLLSKSLEEVWNSENFKTFRKNSNLICDSCEMLKLPEC